MNSKINKTISCLTDHIVQLLLVMYKEIGCNVKRVPSQCLMGEYGICSYSKFFFYNSTAGLKMLSIFSH